MRRLTGLVIALSLVVLTGCTSPSMPEPMSADEIQAIRDAQNADWWRSISATEPMPDIEPIRVIAEGDREAVINGCALAAVPPGVAAQQRAGQFPGRDGAAALDRAYFRCTLQYPVEIGDPTAEGLLSQDQLAWLYDYYDTRLIPCLRLTGYLVGAIPQREEFVDSIFGHWSPYYAMSPQPDSPSEWAQIDVRCPPPPFGDRYRPGLVIP